MSNYSPQAPLRLSSMRMVDRCLLLVVSVCLCGAPLCAESLTWTPLPNYPDPLGVAAPVAGVIDGALFVGGGANFPDRTPWEGGTKVWHDRIWRLDLPTGKWQAAGQLPQSLAYAVCVTHGNAIICVGGSDAERHFANAFRIRWREGRAQFEPLPALPKPVANACGAMLSDVLYVAGGTETPTATTALAGFYALDLSDSNATWKSLPTWPGAPRMLSVAAVVEGSFFLVSGVSLAPDDAGKPRRTYLADAFCYRPANNVWQTIAAPPRAVVAAPSPAPTIGPSHFVVLGGDDGSLVDYEPKSSHPGFPGPALAYHTITGTWAQLGEVQHPRVTVPTVPWQGGWVIPSGEMRPAVRSPDVNMLRIARGRREFGWVNYATLACYPLVMLGITWVVGRKRTSDEFFRGGKHLPWWAVGLSIYATMLSSITFMSIPAKAYATDWSFLLANISVPLLAPLIIAVYLPFFRQLDVTSAYEYLERRFNVAVRWFGSASFILFQIGRTAIVLYLPALALATVSNFDMLPCILLMGGICILMTFQGGLESVVWTDVAQTVILLVGALATIVVALLQTPGGAVEAIELAQEDHKLFGNLRWDAELAVATGWVILLGNLFLTLSAYTAGQDIVQRYVSTKTSQQAARSIWTNGWMVIPSTLLFLAVGTALYAFYKTHPQQLDPTLEAERIFPLFIVSQLPAGVAGLVVAGIFAAAQPTSSLNSIATSWVTDFHVRLVPQATDAAQLRIAKIVTIVAGVIGTAAAALMTQLDIVSAWEAFLSWQGFIMGTLTGLFTLGIFSRRAHGAGAVVGLIASVLLLVVVRFFTEIHFLLFGAIGVVTCALVGWLASCVLPGRPVKLDGLTMYTLRRE